MSAKDKKPLVPRLRFAEFWEAGEWNARPLITFCKIQTGKKDANEGTENGQYPFFTCSEKHIYSNSYSFDTEAILIAGNAKVGQTKYYKGKFEAYQRTYVLYNFQKIEVRYLYIILSAKLRDSLVRKVQQSAMSYIKLSMLKEHFVALPTNIAEQQKIAACLTALDDLISAATERLDALKHHKQGLMQQLFPAQGETVPRLRFAEFWEAGEWKLKEIREVGNIVTGKTPNTKDNSLWNGNILFITPTDIHEQAKYQISTQRKVVETKETKLLPPGSIVYTCIASIGKIAITKGKSISNQQINSIITNFKNNNEFIYYCLLHLTPWIKSIPASSTLPIINKQEFSKIKIRITPTKKEQQKIAACLTALDDLISAQTQKIAKLKTHKRGLMQQLFPAVDETH